MKPDNAEHIGIDCDLSECSMDDAVYKILAKIGEPNIFILRCNALDKFRALRLVNNSFYPAAVVVSNEHYEELNEWSLTGEGPKGAHCIWSPGA